ncbi:MAG TPA: EamA family transporter, partial [Opitutae bacterium]|nr:EamA family transporter [Opitutae bacterium]
NNAVVPLALFFSLFIFGEVGVLSAGDLSRLAIGGVLIASAVFVASYKRDFIV